MTKQPRSGLQITVWAAIVAAIAAIGFLDLTQPAGVVFSGAYVAVIFLAYSFLEPRQSFAVVLTCVAASIVVAFIHALGQNLVEESIERALVIGALGLTAYVMSRRRHLHQSLEESEARFRALFDGAADGMLIVDIDGIIRSANRAAERLLGYDRGQLHAAHLDMILPVQYRESHRQAMIDYAAGRLDLAHILGVTREVEVLRHDGVVIPIEINVSALSERTPQLFSAVIRDITERREAEQRMREGQRTLSTLMSNLPGMAYRCLYDESWTMLFVSQGCAALTGYEVHELELSRTISYEKIIYPADRESVARGVRNALNEGLPYNLNYRIIHKSGDIRWVSEKGIAVRGRDGRVVCLEGFISDITREKRSEEALRESELRFRTIADSTPFMIWASGPDMGITFANARVLEYFDLPLDAMLGEGWLDIVYPPDREHVRAVYTAAFTAWRPYECEYRVRRADGQWRWLLVHGVPRFAPGGDFTGYIGSAMDIHDRKNAEIALRESEERFRDVANQTPAVIWMTAPDGSCSFVNSSWERITGQSCEQAMGTGWLEVLHPESRQNIWPSIRQALDSRRSFENELRVRAADGRWRILLNTGTPRFGAGGGFIGFIGSAVDITERRKADHLIWQIARGVTSAIGDEFFRSLALHLAEALEADIVSVGELLDPPTRMKTVAVVRDGQVVDDLEYDLAGTPCAEALREGEYACVEDVQMRFPTDAYLRDNGVCSYIGQALRDSTGRSYGIIWVLYRRSVAEVDLAISLLRIFAVRAAVELERRRATDALRLSEERFRLALRAGEFIVFQQDASLRYTWIHNPAGLTPTEVLGHTDRELLPPAQADVLDSFKREVLCSGVGGRIEVELSPGGEPRIYDLIAEPVVDSANAVTGITCISTDITERKRMERALRDSEARYRRLFENAPLPLMEDDFSGIRAYLDELSAQGVGDLHEYFDRHPEALKVCHDRLRPLGINAAGRRLLGLRTSGDLADGILPLSTPTSFESFGKFVLALRAGCTTYEDETTLSSLEGDRRQVVIYSMVAPGHERTWDLVVTSMIDVTAQRRAEDALRLSEARYRQMFDASPMAKIELDLSEVRAVIAARVEANGASIEKHFETDQELLASCMQKLRFAAVNATAVRVFRAENTAHLRANIPSLFTDATKRAFADFLTRLWNGQMNYDTETEFRALDGALRTGDVHCVLTTGNADDWSQVLVAMLDVTESRQAEEELSRAKRLETAGRLAGQIAHDFNNLLGPLVAYPEILQAKFPDQGRAHEMLRDMQEAALQIAEINQELLTLSRRGHYNTEPLDLNKLVMSAARTAELPSTVTLDLRLSPGETIIRGGSAQLMRLLLNLIRNAVEAMEDVGVLTVKTDSVYLDEPMRRYATVARGEYARVEITDTGCGIPEDALEHIFEPFFTTKKADRRRGTGLGLAVVHSVVEDHEGYIDVASAPGRGSTFSLYFPLYRGEVWSSETSSAIRDGRGEKILVVDDDPLQRRIAQMALERIGYQVTALECGEDAIRFIAANPMDIVILDMVMGGIDGAETLRQIRMQYPDQPALILTGYSTSERAQAALKLGRCELLAKPIQVSTLTNAIARLLQLRSQPTRTAMSPQ